jgi:hypothetical protein
MARFTTTRLSTWPAAPPLAADGSATNGTRTRATRPQHPRRPLRFPLRRSGLIRLVVASGPPPPLPSPPLSLIAGAAAIFLPFPMVAATMNGGGDLPVRDCFTGGSCCSLRVSLARFDSI